MTTTRTLQLSTTSDDYAIIVAHVLTPLAANETFVTITSTDYSTPFDAVIKIIDAGQHSATVNAWQHYTRDAAPDDVRHVDLDTITAVHIP